VKPTGQNSGFNKYLVVIVGPTAVGKTAMAIQVAKHFRTEIVSADSRQFFRELNIGTAKPSVAELNEVRHHLVNSLSIQDEYNAGRFETDALECILKIFSEKNIAVLCGGSGLYVDLVCQGSDEMPARNPELRDQLNELYKKNGLTALQEKLKLLDPEFYEIVDLNNPHRLIRALEVCISSGKKYSELRTSTKNKRPFTIVKIGLEDDREKIYRRIDERVDEMMNHHLLEEAKSLFQFRSLNALQTVGYSELFDFIDGNISLEEAVRLIKQHTRNYAKRQWTWFRKDNEIKWFHPGEKDGILEYISTKIL